MSEYDEKITKLNIVYDLCVSIEAYTKPTDELISLQASKTPKNNLQIQAQIKRDGIIYDYRTEVIYAGGYNIQKFHLRYITITNLPKTNNNSVANEYKEKIKKLDKISKLKEEIEQQETAIQKNAIRIAEASKLTDDEIIEKVKSDPKKHYTEYPRWEEIVKRGANVNYNNSETEFNEAKEKYRNDTIQFYKTQNINFIKTNNETRTKQLQKLKAKLSELTKSQPTNNSELDEAIETLNLMLEILPKEEHKEIKEAIEILKMLK
jgi:hypothetical protein